MYIPMYKNRSVENRFLKNYEHYFDYSSIIPYIEIINTDIINEMDSCEEDLVQYYDQILQGRYFIDFFTFDPEIYPQSNMKKLQYSLSLRTDNKNDYLNRLMSTINSVKAIPVISIKSIRENILKENIIKELIYDLQENKKVIALRIEANLYNEYSIVINSLLRENDYLFFDISEESTDPYFFEILELRNQSYNKILTNSPRKRNLNNTSYLESGYTDLINNFAREIYKEEGFNGIADYSGLKDDLPKRGGGGKGAALAMLFSIKNNKFYTIVNKNTSDGVRGYKNVLSVLNDPKVISELELNNCLAYKYIGDNMNQEKSGNYATWNYITLIRMISEIKKSTNKYYL